MNFMKIKERLITAFLIMIIIPIFLISAAGSAIINYQMNSIQQSYDVDSDTLQILINPMQILNRVTRGTYNDIKLCANKTPEKLENMQYIESLNSELKEKHSYLILRKGKEYIFTGDTEGFKKVKKSLPNFGNYNVENDGGLYMEGKYPYFLKQQDFRFSDNSEGSIFIITDVNTLVPEFKHSIIQLGIAFIIVICLTATILTLWIYQGILRPLRTLKKATNEIKEGNLDYSISGEGEDEISLLCQDFEEMRIRLKGLIEVRMQYEKDTRELISNISHDLKTPITAIKGYAEGLLDGVADIREKREKYLKTIYTKASDMTYLVEELSFYSKIDCNTIPYTFRDISVDSYFKDCISELTLDLEVKNIDLAYFNYTDISLEVVADAEQVKRVINNIIGNSVKYIGKKKGIINIRIKDADAYVQFEFEDNGKGIAQKDIPLIFDRFYRTDTSRNSSQGGTGLGLSIVKKIIEDHGGKVWASSKEGVGTCIFFTLKKSKKCLGKEEIKLQQEERITEKNKAYKLLKIGGKIYEQNINCRR